jgi:hypothetical protein
MTSVSLVPSENFGVMRFLRQVINENSYIGTMATSQSGADGSYNFAYGPDGNFKPKISGREILSWSTALIT